MPAFGFQGLEASEDSMIRLQKNLNYIIMNLDSKNVRRLNTNECYIKSENGETAIIGSQITMTANGSTTIRLGMGYNPVSSNFEFGLYNNAGSQTVGIDSSGNAAFIGTITASEIICGSSTGTYFHVNSSGTMTCYNGYFKGVLQVGSSTGTYFHVDSSGNMTAYNGQFKGQITGSTIISGTFKTAESGERIEISNNTIRCYNSTGNLHGLAIESTEASRYGDLNFFSDGAKSFSIYNRLNGFTLMPYFGYPLTVGSIEEVTYLENVYTGNLAFVQSTAPDITASQVKLYYDGTNLKAVLPDGTQKILTWST
jgi:hypothetical protein